GARHIEFHRSLADRKALQRGVRFGNDRRITLCDLLLVRRRGGRDGRLDYSAVARIAIEDISVNAPRLTILAAALVASQSRFDTDGRLVGPGLSIPRHPLRLQPP